MAEVSELPMSTVVSSDGTAISYRTTPSRARDARALVIVPGNNRRAYHYDPIALALSDSFVVHTIDRRGRGASGPQGDNYTADLEADDVAAVLADTGAELVFGHSYGGLVSLRLAIRHSLKGLVVYEPGVSINAGFDLSWLDDFNRLYYEGKRTSAMSLFLRRSDIVPIGHPPRFVFRLLALLLLYGGREGAETRALMATSPLELGEIRRLDSDGSEYSAIASPLLLLAGTRTNPYLPAVANELAVLIPEARAEVIDGLDHNAPDLSNPTLIADRIRTFFGATTG